MWHMLHNHEEWQSFYQVASVCELWAGCTSSGLGLFDPDTTQSSEQTLRFVSAVICCGRIDILAAFTQMESFCHPFTMGFCEPFDLFSTEQKEPRYGVKRNVALRPLAKALDRGETFRPFFEHVDNVQKSRHEIIFLFDEILKRIRDGMSLHIHMIKAWFETQKQNFLSLPFVPKPLGLGLKDTVMSSLDLSSHNWLNNDHVFIDKKERTSAFEHIVGRNDHGIYQWIFGLTMKHDDYSSHDQESLDHFMYDAVVRISKCCSWDALEEFISFMTGPEGPQKYREDRPLLVTDLLNVDGRNVMKKKDSSTKNWVGGILGLLFEEALIIPGNCVFRGDNSKAPDPVEIANKIERIFHFVHALLADPIVTSVLSNTSSREKLIQNMMTGDPFSSSYLLTTSTSVAFRIVKLLQSKGFDLVNADLVSHFLRSFSELSSLQLEENKEKQKDYLKHFYDGEVYRDDSGKLVFSAADLIRWMALNLRAPIQHISFQDFCDDTFFPPAQKDQMARFMTEEKFEALKKEQLELFNRS